MHCFPGARRRQAASAGFSSDRSTPAVFPPPLHTHGRAGWARLLSAPSSAALWRLWRSSVSLEASIAAMSSRMWRSLKSNT